METALIESDRDSEHNRTFSDGKNLQLEGGAEATRETFGLCTNERVHEGFLVPAFEAVGQFRKLRKFSPLSPKFPGV